MSDKAPPEERNIVCYYDAAGNFLGSRTAEESANVTGIFDAAVGKRYGWHAAHIGCPACRVVMKAVWPGGVKFPFQCPKCRARTAEHLEDIH